MNLISASIVSLLVSGCIFSWPFIFVVFNVILFPDASTTVVLIIRYAVFATLAVLNTVVLKYLYQVSLVAFAVLLVIFSLSSFFVFLPGPSFQD